MLCIISKLIGWVQLLLNANFPSAANFSPPFSFQLLIYRLIPLDAASHQPRCQSLCFFIMCLTQTLMLYFCMTDCFSGMSYAWHSTNNYLSWRMIMFTALLFNTTTAWKDLCSCYPPFSSQLSKLQLFPTTDVAMVKGSDKEPCFLLCCSTGGTQGLLIRDACMIRAQVDQTAPLFLMKKLFTAM